MIQKPAAGKDVFAHNLVIISLVNRSSITRFLVSVEVCWRSLHAQSIIGRGGEKRKKIVDCAHTLLFLFSYAVSSLERDNVNQIFHYLRSSEWMQIWHFSLPSYRMEFNQNLVRWRVESSSQPWNTSRTQWFEISRAMLIDFSLVSTR